MSLEVLAHKSVHDALLPGSVTALSDLIGDRIYDRVPARTPKYPYVVIDIEVRDDATTCSNASEVHATIHVYSNAVGTQEAKTIGGLIRGILAPDDPTINLVITGYLVSMSAFNVAVYRAGDTPLITEGVIDFTYSVDPAD